MKKLWKFLFHSWHGWLLFLCPAAVALDLMGTTGLPLFVLSAAAIIPLAGILGEATEELALHVGPAAGGLLNSTFGNAGELMLGFLALRAGHLDVVKASITGSIIGNVLLVFGLSAFLGGLKRTHQKFNRTAAGATTTMLMLAVAALIMPALFSFILDSPAARVESLSRWTSLVLILTYGAGLVFSLITHRNLFGSPQEQHQPARLTRGASITLLLVATGLVGWMSEIFVGTIEPAAHAMGMSKLFVGVVVVAMIGNAAEHAAAILLARRNQMDLALSVSVGSSVQIALLVAPVLVFASYGMGQHLTLVFNPFEIAAVVLSVLVISMVVLDGETNWFEGCNFYLSTEYWP